MNHQDAKFFLFFFVSWRLGVLVAGRAKGYG
jgi:hypothetical protein